MRGHQNGRARVRETLIMRPEGAARQRIDAGSRLIEEQHARLVHDRSTKGYALLPSAGQAAGDLLLLALRPENASTQRIFSSRSASGTP